jgi:hypothetical protein
MLLQATTCNIKVIQLHGDTVFHSEAGQIFMGVLGKAVADGKNFHKRARLLSGL